MELNEIEEKMREAVNKIETVGGQYAEAKALSWLLQEQKKVVLATLMGKSAAKTVNAKELEALQSPEFTQHLDGTKEAIGDEGRLRASWEKWKAQFEACRSLISAEKEKMKIV